MMKGPVQLTDANLSAAWARAFLELMRPGVDGIVPLTVTVTGFADSKPVEVLAIRQALDRTLVEHGQPSSQTVASTIFPTSLWRPDRGREALFQRYLRILPEIKRLDSHNRYGTYFERLIAFRDPPINQLDHIVRTYQAGIRRHSALQAAVFDPMKDHTRQRRRGFPCLQQLAFTPRGRGELAVTGFYATQYVFEKAYGNYLGLYQLGRFMAHEMGLQLAQVTCVAGLAKLGDVSKNKLRDLARILEGILSGTVADGCED